MPHPTTPAVVRHPEASVMVALDPGVDYAADDVLVKAYPWAFKPIADDDREVRESVTIEKATAEPGQKRNRARSRS